MSRNRLGLISGRVKVVDPTNVSSDRFNFLSLDQAEPNLGVPDSNNSLLGSDTSGTREFFDLDQGLSVTGSNEIFVDETTVPIDTSQINFSSSTVLSNVLADFDQSLIDAVDGLLEAVETDNTLTGAGTTANPLSVADNVINADKLDGEDGVYYLDYNNFINAPSLSVVNAYQDRYEFTATANQTTFTGADDNNETLQYAVNSIDVYLNGILLSRDDYTATSGDTIELNSGAAAGDLLSVVVTTFLIDDDAVDNDLLVFDNTTNKFEPVSPSNVRNTLDVFSKSESDNRYILNTDTTDDLTEGSTNLYYTDTRVRNALSANTGIDYSSATGEFSLADTTVTAGSFGSASEVPVITVDAQGRITSASTTNVAGVSSFSYDNSTGDLDIGTATFNTVTSDVTGDVTGTVSDISNHDTDDLSEGTTNLYYTDSRVRNAVSASGDLSYNSTTGTFSFTERTDAEVRGLLSAAGDLNYNSTTGEFSVTTFKSSDFDSNFSGKSTTDLSEGTNLYYTDARVDAHLSGGSGIDFSAGTISHSDTSSVGDVTASSNTFVDALTFDDFGHVTAVSTSTAAPPNDATITVSAGTGLNGGGLESRRFIAGNTEHTERTCCCTWR